MTGKALLIVDVQNDFVEGGALGVEGGTRVAKRINDYLRDNLQRYDAIVASMDWHQPDSTNGGHIALPPDEPDFIDNWPPHCIQSTDGADLHEHIWDVLNWTQTSTIPTIIVKKGQGVPAYSAFEGVMDTGQDLVNLLHDNGITEIDVVGIATDYCVRSSVLDAIEADFSVTVLTDMIAGVDHDRSIYWLNAMAANGATVAHSSRP